MCIFTHSPWGNPIHLVHGSLSRAGTPRNASGVLPLIFVGSVELRCALNYASLITSWEKLAIEINWTYWKTCHGAAAWVQNPRVPRDGPTISWGVDSCETGSLLSLPALAANYTKAATAGVWTKKLSQQSRAILIHVPKYLLWLTMWNK